MQSIAFRAYHLRTAAEMNLTEEEISEAFEGSIFSIIVTAALVVFIQTQFGTSGSLCIVIPDSFIAFFARFLSAYLMHLQIEPMLRNGLHMMKYSMNHPQEFSNYGLTFFQGFVIFFNSLLVEYMTLLYLSSLTVTIDIIVKQVCMAAIAKVGIFFAAALPASSKLVQYKGIPTPKVTHYREMK
jgi:hypothetical protein